MTETQRLRHLHRRRIGLDLIKRSAEDFKVCLQCYSLLPTKDRVCRYCAAYRFDADPRMVRATSRSLPLLRRLADGRTPSLSSAHATIL